MHGTFKDINQPYDILECAYIYLTEKLWLVNGRKGDFMHGPEMTDNKIIVCCRETSTSGENDRKLGLKPGDWPFLDSYQMLTPYTTLTPKLHRGSKTKICFN